MPRIVACGSRGDAYDDFMTAIRKAEAKDFIVLLVDSEQAVLHGDGPWAHLSKRDGWTQPRNASDENVQLMVRCMEAWFVAESEHLERVLWPRF